MARKAIGKSRYRFFDANQLTEMHFTSIGDQIGVAAADLLRVEGLLARVQRDFVLRFRSHLE